MKKSFKIILNISLIFLILVCFMFCCPFGIVNAGDDSAEEETEEDEIDAVSGAASSWLQTGENEYKNIYGDEDIDLLNTSFGNFLYTAAILVVAIIDLGLVGFYIMEKIGLGISPESSAKLKTLTIIIVISNILVVGLPLIVKFITNLMNGFNS